MNLSGFRKTRYSYDRAWNSGKMRQKAALVFNLPLPGQKGIKRPLIKDKATSQGVFVIKLLSLLEAFSPETMALTEEDRAWLAMPPVGREVIDDESD